MYIIKKMLSCFDCLSCNKNDDRFSGIMNQQILYASNKMDAPVFQETKYITIDNIKFDSNKLDNLGKFLGLGEKLETGGFELWLGCMAGDMKSWKKMCDYNKQDVILLEKVYLALRPWMTNHPNLGVLDGFKNHCPNCDSCHVTHRGYGLNSKSKYERLQCQDCSAWFKGVNVK